MKPDIEIEIQRDRIIIDGFRLEPYWKRLILVLCWWKNPKIILTNPKVFYRWNNGELWNLQDALESEGVKK